MINKQGYTALSSSTLFCIGTGQVWDMSYWSFASVVVHWVGETGSKLTHDDENEDHRTSLLQTTRQKVWKRISFLLVCYLDVHVWQTDGLIYMHAGLDRVMDEKQDFGFGVQECCVCIWLRCCSSGSSLPQFHVPVSDTADASILEHIEKTCDFIGINIMLEHPADCLFVCLTSQTDVHAVFSIQSQYFGISPATFWCLFWLSMLKLRP